MEELSNIKFNLTPLMADKIVAINNLKIKLNTIEKQIQEANNGDDNLNLINEKEKIIKEIDYHKKKFIKEFQKNNKEQINEYLKLTKD